MGLEVLDDARTMGKVVVCQGPESMQVDDGYHTLDEVYEHRIQIFITLARQLVRLNATLHSDEVPTPVWRSKQHHVGGDEMFDGWFIIGIGKDQGKQISYHVPLSRWEEMDFAETLTNAPEWDRHTSQDVLDRLKNL